jgi:hypothetical protein
MADARVWNAAVRRGGVCAAGVLAMVASQCGSSAVGVDACRRIESARCDRAPACQVPLDVPNYTSGTAAEACVRFYDTACLHGLTVSDPGGTAVNACVTAIQTGACEVVTSPATDPRCAWLSPGTSTADAETSDASAAVVSDASDSAVAASEASDGTAGDALDGAADGADALDSAADSR